MATYPENLSADVSGPLLFQRVALGVLDQVCHWAGSTELHDQLQTYKVDYWLFCKKKQSGPGSVPSKPVTPIKQLTEITREQVQNIT